VVVAEDSIEYDQADALSTSLGDGRGLERHQTMKGFWSRVASGTEGPLVGVPGVAADAVVERLERGEPYEAVLKSFGLELGDILAALAVVALGDDDSLGPALIQTRPTRPGLHTVISEPALAAAGVRGDRASRLALAAGLLQVHDFWDTSHEAAQAADDLGERVTSAYWHAIAHRREPDAGNSAYWFRRVGQHAIFDDLDKSSRSLIQREGDPAIQARYSRSTGWEPSALIELTNRARPGTPSEALARRLQRLEMRLLLEASAAAVGVV
jgi:hypothetical protein